MIHDIFFLPAFFFSPVEELRAGLVGKLLLVVIGRFFQKRSSPFEEGISSPTAEKRLLIDRNPGYGRRFRCAERSIYFFKWRAWCMRSCFVSK